MNNMKMDAGSAVQDHVKDALYKDVRGVVDRVLYNTAWNAVEDDIDPCLFQLIEDILHENNVEWCFE